MGSSRTPPTPEEAAAALRGAEASRARWAGEVELPSWFVTSIGAAIAVQIGTAALGVGDGSGWTGWALAGGLALFVVVGAVQLARFRRCNGVWLGGLAGSVVLGTGTGASSSYVVAFGAAVWAAFGDQWLLVAFASAGGGAAYALAGRRWLATYRTAPDEHGRGAPAAWSALLAIAAVGGFVVLVLER